MEKKGAKYFLWILLLTALFLLSSNEASAKIDANFSITPVSFLARGENTVINITIGSVASTTNNIGNITQIDIIIPGQETLNTTSNGTSLSVGANFSARQVGQNTLATFKNSTLVSLVANNSVTSFWFTVKGREFLTGNAGADATTIIINVTSVDHTAAAQSPNQTSKILGLAFSFSGYIKNETGCSTCWSNYTNVSVYQYVMSTTGGPPTEIFVASNVTTTDGSFIVRDINASSQLYKVRVIHYNDTGVATKVGTDLPPLPSMMFFAMGGDIFSSAKKDFEKPPTINGTTFYLQPAATINISATNSSTRQTFGYEVIDQVSGYPIISNIFANASTAQVVVPISRNVTVMLVRPPNIFPFYPGEAACNGFFMNGSHCPTPPISNSTLGALIQGQVLNVQMNLSIMQSRLKGCIFAGGNVSDLNLTLVIPKMVPWPGFVPPIKADRGDINLTLDFMKNEPSCGAGSIGMYNISLLSSGSGINYLVEFYTKNTATEAQAGNGSEYFAAFQNVSMTSNLNYNITLNRLLGANDSSTFWSVNTSKIKVNIQNSTGQALTTNTHVDVIIKRSTFGTMHYIIEETSGGSFMIPLLNDTTSAKVTIYPQGPPVEKTINLSRTETNITVDDSNGFGFRKVNSSGQFVAHNVSATPIQMKFLINSPSCNVPNPSTADCVLTSMTAESFNPFKAMMAGKVNLEMTITATNVTIRYVNFDMFAAKPPTNSIFSQNASSFSSSSTSLEQIWEFGGFAPSTAYDHVEIKIPYNDTTTTASSYINEEWTTKLNIPTLYNEDWKGVWNLSAGSTATAVPSEFVEYNTTFYSSLLSSGGSTCNVTAGNANFTSNPCYMNTTANELWLKVPHFSGVTPTVSGTAPAAAASSPLSGSSGGNVGVIGKAGQPAEEAKPAEESKVTPQSPADYDVSLQSSPSATITLSEGSSKTFTLDGKEKHKVNVKSLTESQATITIESNPVEVTLSIGESKDVDVNEDNKNDLTVTLVSIKDKQAEITISNLAPAPAPAPTQPKIQIETKKQSTAWIWILIAIVLVIIIALIVKSKSKGKHSYRFTPKEK